AERAAGNRALAHILRQARAQGQTVLVASGDKGDRDCTPGRFGLLASSPLVATVGGTAPQTVLDSGSNALRSGAESVWHAGGGVSGGGGRARVPRPGYQRGHGSQRTVPDVAFPGAAVFPIVWDGNHVPVGGTSAAAPAWAGLVARLVQLRGRRVGFLNPAL